MATLANLARMTTATAGTGTITLGSAASGYLTFAQAGITDGQTVSYGIADGSSSREVGRGVYTSSGTTLTRSVLRSTNSNNAINLSGTAEVFITALAEDLNAGTKEALATEIMADTPTAYWKCDDSGSTLADSGGGGFTLTLSGTTTVNHSPLLSNDTQKYLRLGGTSGRASATTGLGLSFPLTGDWTACAIVLPENVGTNAMKCFFLGGNPAVETEADNIQAMFNISTGQTTEAFWENGAGTNISTTSPYTYARNGEIVMVHAVKDGTANTVTFYRNGKQMGAAVSYGSEPTGGSGTMFVNIGNDSVSSAGQCVIGHVAFFNGSKLSAARIYAHAMAAGFTGH